MIRRTYAYIVFGAGALLVVAGLLKLLPGSVGAGAALCFLGLAFFGLSFVPHRPPEDRHARPSGAEVGGVEVPAPPAPAAPPPMPFFARLTGMFFEPSQVFKNLRWHPRWLAPLVVIVLLNFVYATAFTQRLTPERIVNFTTDKVIQSFNLPHDQAEAMKREQIDAMKSPPRVALGAVGQFVGAFVLMCILAGLALLAVLLLGGSIGFWQALSVLAHATLPAAIIERALSLVILYLKAPEDIHPVLGQQGLVTDNLGALFNPAQNPVLFSAASFIGVLAFYRLWLTATGLRNGSTRVSSGMAWTVAVGFWAVGLLFAIAMSALFPQFIS